MCPTNLIVRFDRTGRKHYQLFKIVVINRKKRNRGPAFDCLGYYNPQVHERAFFLNVNLLGF